MNELLFLQDRDGLIVRRRQDVARLREEAFGRLEALDAWGGVAHGTGPLADVAGPPFTAVGGELLHPGHVRHGDGGPVLPGGWAAPDLAPAPPPPPPDEVLYLQATDGRAWWVTDTGRRPAGASAKVAARTHPHLVKAGRGTYVNALRLRAIRNERKRFRLVLDDGTELTVSWGARQALATDLGLARLDRLPGTTAPQEAMLREGLRDWPWRLTDARAEDLRAAFGTDARRLIANLLWETARFGIPDRGREYRGFWYLTLLPVLVQAGLARHGLEPSSEGGDDLLRAFLAGDSLELLAALGEDRLYDLLELLTARLVGQDRLFQYRDLGFRDPRPDLRVIGERLPHVLVAAEKHSLRDSLHAVARAFGVSTLVLGGLPSLMSTEFLAADLLARGIGEIDLLAYVDFDPGGWVAADGLAAQLQRYGIRTRRLRHVVRPGLFTPEEIARYALPIPTPTPQVAGKVRAWVKRSGGVDGRALGLHADHLRPAGRVLEAVRRLLPA